MIPIRRVSSGVAYNRPLRYGYPTGRPSVSNRARLASGVVSIVILDGMGSSYIDMYYWNMWLAVGGGTTTEETTGLGLVALAVVIGLAALVIWAGWKQ